MDKGVRLNVHSTISYSIWRRRRKCSDIGKDGINNTGNGGDGGRGGRNSFSRQKSTYGGSGIIVLHYFKYK